MHDSNIFRIRALAREYITYVEVMRDSALSSEEYQHLSAQRTLVHNELIDLTGIEKRASMYGYCKDLLRKKVGT